VTRRENSLGSSGCGERGSGGSGAVGMAGGGSESPGGSGRFSGDAGRIPFLSTVEAYSRGIRGIPRRASPALFRSTVAFTVYRLPLRFSPRNGDPARSSEIQRDPARFFSRCGAVGPRSRHPSLVIRGPYAQGGFYRLTEADKKNGARLLCPPPHFHRTRFLSSR
jgi:hypothetical protein